MAIATGTAIIAGSALAAGGAIAGGAMGASASRRAAEVQAGAATEAGQMQMQQYLQNREDMAPWRAVGEGALNKLAGLYGVTPVTAQPQTQPPRSGYLGGAPRGEGPMSMGEPRLPDIEGEYTAEGSTTPAPTAGTGYTEEGVQGFLASPGYQFRLEEGQKALEKSASARGLLRSGATMKAVQEHAQGVASQEFNTYANRLAAMAGVGQQATTTTGYLGAQAAGQTGQAVQAAGAARASGYLGAGQAWGQAAGGAGSAIGTGLGYLSYAQQPPTQPYTPYPGFGG